MSFVAVAMRELMALGVEGEALVAAVDRLVQAAREENAETLGQAVAAATNKADLELARRKERDRLRKQSVRGIPRKSEDSADSADPPPSQESPQTPKETQPLPVPPIPPKGGLSPKIQPSKAEVDAIWAATPRPGRERSSRKELETALRAAVSRGFDPGAILAGITAAYASPSFSAEYAKGVHRLIQNDRWQSFTEQIEAQSPALDPAREAEIRRRMSELADARAANA